MGTRPDDDAKLPPGQSDAAMPHAHPPVRPDERGETSDEADADDVSESRPGFGEPRHRRERDPELVNETTTDDDGDDPSEPDERGDS